MRRGQCLPATPASKAMPHIAPARQNVLGIMLLGGRIFCLSGDSTAAARRDLQPLVRFAMWVRVSATAWLNPSSLPPAYRDVLRPGHCNRDGASKQVWGPCQKDAAGVTRRRLLLRSTEVMLITTNADVPTQTKREGRGPHKRRRHMAGRRRRTVGRRRRGVGRNTHRRTAGRHADIPTRSQELVRKR
jgi:hypothetical protein